MYDLRACLLKISTVNILKYVTGFSLLPLKCFLSFFNSKVKYRYMKFISKVSGFLPLHNVSNDHLVTSLYHVCVRDNMGSSSRFFRHIHILFKQLQ